MTKFTFLDPALQSVTQDTNVATQHKEGEIHFDTLKRWYTILQFAKCMHWHLLRHQLYGMCMKNSQVLYACFRIDIRIYNNILIWMCSNLHISLYSNLKIYWKYERSLLSLTCKYIVCIVNSSLFVCVCSVKDILTYTTAILCKKTNKTDDMTSLLKKRLLLVWLDKDTETQDNSFGMLILTTL